MTSPIHPQVVLRELRLEDWTSLHEWSQRDEVYRFQVWGPNTALDTQGFVERALADGALDPRRRYVWAAVLPDERVVGIAEIRVHDARSGRAEVSYVVHPEYWRRGYATRMARGAIAVAFDELGMHRVEATCDTRNLASAAVLRKCAMTYEGRSRGDVKLRDGWRDSERFSILRDEWLFLSSTIEGGTR